MKMYWVQAIVSEEGKTSSGQDEDFILALEEMS